MLRRAFLAASLTVGLLVSGVSGASASRPTFEPGAPGIGDPYYPLDGNGGYDVRHYLLDVTYTPDTDELRGVATVSARATQNLSQFNLDLEGLTVRSVVVNGRSASWERSGGELTVTPRRGLRKGSLFTTTVRYDGVPAIVEDPILGPAGFFHTDDGAVVIGEPDVAATWFPVNDHPSDKAAYTVRVTVPQGLTAVSNGVLTNSRTRKGWTTWTWDMKEPMASYLATATVGQFDLHAYRSGGIRYWDAVDPDLYAPVASPRTGSRFALSQVGDLAYKRLAHTIHVPDTGAQLSFWVTRDTEFSWDFAFVEAHTVGTDDWTTLPDRNGHTSDDVGNSCPFWLGLHPFLTHYQSDNGDGTCSPSGTTGTWSAATGASDGYEQWLIDLSRFAGREIEVAISYASDDIIQGNGAYVDDVQVSTGEGTTSFEDDADPLDGWTVPGAPEGSATNPNDWITGTAADTPPPAGAVVDEVFARQPEIIGFLSDQFGRYPFKAAGGIVDDVAGLGFALENQTRPIYAREFFGDPISGGSVVVHELAHQWYGDSLSVASWQHIWLNEGFATYAEWLWSEHESLGTAQDNFDFFYSVIPPDEPFWQVTIGDPGPAALFDFSVYARGAMTLHQLRLTVGDDAFFRTLRLWAARNANGNVTTDEFVRLAEKVSGHELGDLFTAWLFTPGRPDLPAVAAAQAGAASSQAAASAPSPTPFAPPAARSELRRYGAGVVTSG